MSLTKIGMASSPDIEQMKKNIMYEALQHNIREQQLKNIKRKLEKEKMMEEFQLINRRVSTQLTEQNEKNRQRKNNVQSILAQFYEKQIQERKLSQLDQFQKNRSYAQIAEESQNQYYEKRARDLARIYKAQKTVKSVNPEVQAMMSLKMSENLRKNLERISSEHEIIPALSRLKTQEAQNNRIPQSQQPTQHRNYKDYLLQQIERKKQQRQQQAKQRLQIEKELAKQNANSLQKEKQQIKQLQKKQREVFKRGLQEQIAEKNNYRRYY